MKFQRSKNAFKNITSGIVLKIYITLFPFFLKRIIIHKLGLEYLGLDSLFVSILQVLNLAELGVGSAMVFSMYKPVAENDTFKICALLRLYKLYYQIIGFVVLGFGILIMPFLKYLIHSDIPVGINLYVLYSISLMGSVVSYWFLAYRNSILQSHQRNDVINIINIVSTTIRYVLQLIAIALLKNFYYYSVVIVIAQIVLNIMVFIYTRKNYPNIYPSGDLPELEKKEIKKRVKDIFTSKLGGVIITSVDTLVISTFLGLPFLGLYQNYMYIVSAVSSFFMVVLDSCVSVIGNSLVTESIEKNYKDFKGLSFLVNWMSCICICCLINLFQSFITIWLGEEYLLSYSMVILFAIFFHLYSITNYWCVYKNAAGIWHQDRFRPLIGSFVNLSLNLLFVNKYGLYSIILSTIVSYVVVIMPWLLINNFKYIFKRNISKFILPFLTQNISIVLCAIISFWVCGHFDDSSVLSLLLRLIVSVSISTFGYGLIFCGTGDFKYFVDLIFKIKRQFIKRS